MKRAEIIERLQQLARNIVRAREWNKSVAQYDPKLHLELLVARLGGLAEDVDKLIRDLNPRPAERVSRLSDDERELLDGIRNGDVDYRADNVPDTSAIASLVRRRLIKVLPDRTDITGAGLRALRGRP